MTTTVSYPHAIIHKHFKFTHLIYTDFSGLTGLQAVKQKDGEKMEEEEQPIHVEEKTHHRFPSMNTIDRDKLLFSVFSLLQKLGADERPEVWYLFLWSDIGAAEGCFKM